MPTGHHIATCFCCGKYWDVGDCVPSVCRKCESDGHDGSFDCKRCEELSGAKKRKTIESRIDDLERRLSKLESKGAVYGRARRP